MVLKYAQWLQNNRLTVYLLSAALACVTTFGLIHFTFKVDYRTFFASDGLGYVQFQHMEDNFPTGDDLVFVIAPESGEVFNQEVIDALLWLKEQIGQLPFIETVEAITDYPFQANHEGELYIGYLTDEPNEVFTLESIRKLALDDPMVSGSLVGHKGQSFALFTKYSLPGVNDLVEFPDAMDQVNALRSAFADRYSNYELAIAGVLTYNHGIIDTALNDLILLLPICSVIIFLILYFFLRSWRGASFTMLIIGLSLGSAVGVWCWLGIPLNSASISGPIAILALAVADCIHMSDSYLLIARDDPDSDSVSHINQSVLLNSKPIFLTSLTSVLGFLTMNLCDSPPYQDIGNLVAIGICFAWLYSMTLFPALVGQFGLRRSEAQLHLNQWLQRLADFINRDYKKVLLGYGLVIVLSLGCLSFNELDDNVVEWFDEDIQLRRDAEFIDSIHTGMYQLYYIVESEKPNGVLEPATLNAIQDFQTWLRQQPEVVQVRSLVDLLGTSYRAMTNSAKNLPASAGMSKQILSTFEMLSDDDEQLSRLINRDHTALRIHISLYTMPASQFIALEERAQSWLADHAPHLDTGDGGISPSMMFAMLSQQVVPTMLLTTGSMILLISALLIFIFRSAPLGLLSLVPNLLPVGMAFGFWGLFSGHVGIALSIVSGASLGIVVDDTIHLLLKYQRARREMGMSPREAVSYAITRVGDALTITTLTLIAGFFTLGFSSLQPNAELGIMLGSIITTALITDLIFVPALLIWIEERWPFLDKEA